MNRTTLVALLALAFAGNVAADSARSNIRARCKSFVAAWNDHDTEALAAHWAPDGDVINPMGRWGQGRAEIEQLFEEEHGTMMKNSRLTVKEEKIRFLEEDVAIVDQELVLHGMTTREGQEHPPLTHHVTTVMKKSDGQWWFSACRPYVFLTGQKTGSCETPSKCTKCSKGERCAKCAKGKSCSSGETCPVTGAAGKCPKAGARSCKPGCTKPCCAKAKMSCKPGCTKPCCKG